MNTQGSPWRLLRARLSAHTSMDDPRGKHTQATTRLAQEASLAGVCRLLSSPIALCKLRPQSQLGPLVTAQVYPRTTLGRISAEAEAHGFCLGHKYGHNPLSHCYVEFLNPIQTHRAPGTWLRDVGHLQCPAGGSCIAHTVAGAKGTPGTGWLQQTSLEHLQMLSKSTGRRVRGT